MRRGTTCGMRLRGRRSPGFTLVELMVVIGLFLLLLLIAVPAFSSMMYSSEQSLADNALRSGLNAARDAAARGRQGEDAAAVFFYDTVTRKTSIVPCVRVGVMFDRPVAATGPDPVEREIFVPINGYEPVQLPRGWTVRGHALPNTIDSTWYERTYPTSVRNQANWLFPETDFYDWTQDDSGRERQTFMVRFEGGTGTLKFGDLAAALVLSPAPTDQFRSGGVFSTYRVDRAGDYGRFVRGITSAPFTGPGALIAADRWTLLGDESTDTVLAKPVRLLALCNERELGGGIGVALNRDSGTIYEYDTVPRFLPGVNVDTLNQWILGWNNGQSLDSRARIFSIHRYLGTLQELTGTIEGQGVNQ